MSKRFYSPTHRVTMMDKKVCVITGANSGIGKAAAIRIAQQGYQVIIACRSQERAEVALQEIKKKSDSDSIELMIVDLSLQESIQKLAQSFREKHDTLDVLIHNAAIFDITQKQVQYTSEGVESIWATNHLGPVLLTDLLLDPLKNSDQGRVITIASKGLIAKPGLKVNLNDPEFRKKRFRVTNAYYQSKRAQVIYTYWLAEKLSDTSITANCIRVPAVKVDINKYPNLSPMMKRLYSLKSRSALSPEEMAETYTYLATSDEVSNLSGKYFNENRKQVKSSRYTYQLENINQVMNLTMRYLKKR